MATPAISYPHVTSIPVSIPSGLPSPAPVLCIPSRNISKDDLVKQSSNILNKKCRMAGDVVTVSCYVGKYAIVRGDIARITLGKGVFLDDSCVLRPPLRVTPGKVTAEAIPVTIGNYVHIGPSAVCEAASIGNFVIIEERCVVGERCVVPHGVWLRSCSVVPPGQILEPFAIYSGNPAKKVGRSQEDVHPVYVRELISQLFQSL